MKTLIAAAVLSVSAISVPAQATQVDLATLTDFSVKALTADFIAKQISDIKYSVLMQAEQSMAQLTAAAAPQQTEQAVTDKAPVVKIIDQTGE
ncbi:hypothetical protein [Rheinheimera sp.]|uniref:hypothetical protein n=1 Tax=Rheinheimera sp. TaxID=1869214 RepID=UPI00307F9EE9